MASIRIKNDGSTPVIGPGREAAFKQGDFLVFEVSDEVARYWNKTAPGRREELWKQSKKDKKDLREVVEGYVFRPAHTK